MPGSGSQQLDLDRAGPRGEGEGEGLAPMEAGGSGGAEKSPSQESVLVHAVSFSDFLLFFVAVTAFVVLVSKMAKKTLKRRPKAKDKTR